MTIHYEAIASILGSPADIFARLDDYIRLGEHMAKPTAMMGGGKMTYEFDEGRGQAVGSHIRMRGDVFGLKLFVDEVVTEREVPRRKVWKTVGSPKLLVIATYEMGFELTPDGPGSRLRVWIDYSLPRGALTALGGGALARLYAHWCVNRMTQDARLHFTPPASVSATRPTARVR